MVVVGIVVGTVVCRGSELVVLRRGLVASGPSSDSVRDVGSEAVDSIWASSPRVDPEIPNSKSITLRPTKATPSQGNFFVQMPPVLAGGPDEPDDPDETDALGKRCEPGSSHPLEGEDCALLDPSSQMSALLALVVAVAAVAAKLGCCSGGYHLPSIATHQFGLT